MKSCISTAVPGRKPIELIQYYEQFAGYYPGCEMSTKRWFVENVKSDWIILDCGANIGYFTILFSQLATKGHVYAFEPTSTHKMLVQNLRHHSVKNVTTVQMALGNRVGWHDDAIFRIWGQEPERQQYLFTTIDQFIKDHEVSRVDCIKIDVDSFDFDVLQGAEEALIELNPFVMVELNHALSKRNQSNTEALEWLAKLEYENCIVLDYDNFLLKRGYRCKAKNGNLIGLSVVFANDESICATDEILEDIKLENPVPSAVRVPLEDAVTPVTNDRRVRRRESRKSSKATLTPYGLAGDMPAVQRSAQPFEPPLSTRSSTSKPYIDVSLVKVEFLQACLNFISPINYPAASRGKSLDQWKMEVDDAPIFRYIYRHIRPRRHLEFGTWRGTGTVYCLEECDATVWTVNLPDGENNSGGGHSYSHHPDELPELQAWAQKTGMTVQNMYRTDTLGFIGREYLERSLGNRVCQIYCDSKVWDTSNFPDGFFDSVLIDGGHQRESVISDTQKALPLLRSGGIMMWHDFCPPVFSKFESTRGVMQAIYLMWDALSQEMDQLFWIKPSWILLGVKK